MKIACVADLHGFLPTIEPDTDVLLIAGDIVAASDENQMQLSLLRFGHWLTELVAEHGITPIGVAGNHDFLFQKHNARVFPWVYLEDSGIEFGGLKFWGSPWQNWFGGWAFNAPEFDQGEVFLTEKFSQIPDDTDVLITHCPPAGFFDKVGGKSVGSLALNKRVQQVCPKLHVFGHIHRQGVEQIEGVTLCNAAVTEIKQGEYVHNKQPIYFNV